MFNLTKTQWILIALVVAMLILKTKEHMDHCKGVTSGTVPEGCSILNKEECKEWAALQNKTLTKKDYFCKGIDGCPKGCYTYNKKVYWNNDKTGDCSSKKVCIYK